MTTPRTQPRACTATVEARSQRGRGSATSGHSASARASTYNIPSDRKGMWYVHEIKTGIITACNYTNEKCIIIERLCEKGQVVVSVKIYSGNDAIAIYDTLTIGIHKPLDSDIMFPLFDVIVKDLLEEERKI